MRNLENLVDMDLITEWIGWEVHDELDALIDDIYEEQQKGRKPDIHDLLIAREVFKGLWEKNKRLEVLHKNNQMREKNFEVILVSLTILWGASMTIEGFDF